MWIQNTEVTRPHKETWGGLSHGPLLSLTACPDTQDVARRLAENLILDVSDNVATLELLGPVLHNMRQLSNWSASKEDDRACLQVADSLMALASRQAKLHKLSLQSLPDKFDALETILTTSGGIFQPCARVVHELLALEKDGFILKMCWVVGADQRALATKCWDWITSLSEQLKDFVASYLTSIDNKLLAPMKQLEEELKTFAPTSTKDPKKAGLVKAAVQELEPFSVSAAAGLTEIGEALSEQVEKAQGLVEEAHTKLAHWGLHTCSTHDDVEHILRGARLRFSIKNIMENYEWLLRHLPEQLVSRCQELTSKGTSQGSKQAATSGGAASAADASSGQGTSFSRSEAAKKKGGQPQRVAARASAENPAEDCSC